MPFKEYDNFSKGEQNGDLVVVAGETSQGKTAFALCKAFNQALNGKKVAIFSYEMTTNQITARLMALVSGISAKKTLMDKLSEKEIGSINSKIQELIDTNIYIVEIERKNYDWLEAKIKTIVSKYNIDSIIIDYLQLISGKDGLPKNQQIGDSANALKYLAKNQNIPITVLSQLKRDSSHPKPELWRLKESGDIENSADIVLGIWRPDHYNIDQTEIRKDDGTPEQINTNGIGVLHVLKGRNIGLKDIPLKWEGALTKYSDYEKEETDPF
jgi:replicative DNA helicase